MNPTDPRENPGRSASPVPPSRPGPIPPIPTPPIFSEPAASRPSAQPQQPVQPQQSQPLAQPPQPNGPLIIPPTPTPSPSQPSSAEFQPSPPSQPVATPPAQSFPPMMSTPPEQPLKPLHQPKRSKRSKSIIKRVSIIAAILVAVGVAAWAAWTYFMPGIALETYEGDGFSVQAPANYEQQELSGALFLREPIAEGGSYDDLAYSRVIAQKTSFMMLSMDRDEAIASYDAAYTEEKFSETLSMGMGLQGDEIRQFTRSDADHNGQKAFRVSFDVYRDGERVGSTESMAVFANDAMYTVSVNAFQRDEKLERAKSRIISSFTVDETQEK